MYGERLVNYESNKTVVPTFIKYIFELRSVWMYEKNYESKISEIKEVIEERYNEEFSVVYFQPALDETYDNVLSLSNKDGVVFNAYQKDGYEVDDNYYE